MSKSTGYRVSLLVNGLLAAVVMAMAIQRQAGASTSAATPERSKRAAANRGQLHGAKMAGPNAPSSGAELRRQVVDGLRAQGVPENVLARFALTDIEESWAGRFEACRGDQNKLAAVQLEHDRGLDAEMRTALGDAAFRRWDQKNLLKEAMLGSTIQLSAGEADAIYDLKKKLQARQWELEDARLRGKMDDVAVSSAYDQAFTEFGQQMKAVLGDARFAQAMRPDDGSSALQETLAKANASDAQFQQLLAAQRDWNDRRAALDQEFKNVSSSELYVQRIKTLMEEQNQEYQRVLGPEAFAKLQKEQDGSYMKMKKYADTWGLDDNQIESVYGTIKYYQKTLEDYQDQARLLEGQGQPADWGAINRNLERFTEQTKQTLRDYLGAANFDRLQQNGVLPFNPPPPHRPPPQ